MAAPTSISTFALTKIQPPRARAGLVVRSRLESRLQRALATHKLVLLCAPAGFGKTAALTRVLGSAAAGPRSAWVSLDEDDDLQRLLACLFAALEPFDPPWRVAPEALVAAAGRSRQERRHAVDELVNTLAATETEAERAVVVLDDVHRVEDPAVFEFLDLLIERLPAEWGLVVSSRVEPPLALARWRATDEVAEFREPDLRFDAADVAALTHQSDAAALHPADLELLLARTGGWVAGLRLALRNTPGGDASGLAWARAGTAMDRHAFDYLASEVLAQLPADLGDFLLRTSVLPELCASRCAALLDDASAPRHLIEIERRGLFATLLDGPELTLRLHDLFRDFLEDRLRRSAAAALPALLVRAAESEPDDARRVGYLLRAGDWPAAESALQGFVPAWLSLGLLAQSQRLLEQFPPARRERSARLALLQGLAAWARWDFAAMDGHFATAQRLASAAGDTPTRLRAAAYVALGHCQMDRRDEAARLIAELRREALPDDAAITLLTASTWHAGDYGPVDAAAGFIDERNRLLARSDDVSLWYQATPNPRDVMLPGMRDPLSRFVEQALLVAPDQANPLGAIVALMHGLMALWDGDAVTAAQRLARADEAARWLGRPRNVGTMLALATGMLHALRGDIEACRAVMQHLLADPDHEPPGPRQAKLRRHLQFQALRLAMVVGDTEQARQLAAELGAAEPTGSGRIAQRARELALPAFAAELAEDWPLAAQRWQAALATPEALDWYGLLTEGQLRAAAAVLRSAAPGALDTATSLVEQARQRCDADGWPGSALLAGPTALATLASALPPGSAATQVQAWLAIALRMRRPSLAEAPPLRAAWSMPSATAPSRNDAIVAGAVTDTELSSREREVLEHIAAGDSNKLIARALDLSPHTVKRHVANILDKLGLDSRGQAAAWLRAHA